MEGTTSKLWEFVVAIIDQCLGCYQQSYRNGILVLTNQKTEKKKKKKNTLVMTVQGLLEHRIVHVLIA